jgi:transcriptional regulator with XRE-family HTH domain
MIMASTRITAHIARKIKEARTAAVNQTQIGDAIGVSYQQVQRYESGTDRTSVAALVNIARATGKPIIWFFEGVPS